MKKIHIINGPNLNMLGLRQKELYGDASLADVNRLISDEASRLELEVNFFQSNSEGGIIDYIHSLYGLADGIIINAGAYSHYSLAIADAISAVNIPTVEVHITNTYKREPFRSHSAIAAVCEGQITGLGAKGYILALNYLKTI